MKMRKPPKGRVWLHIDRLDREDGKVWAVQSDGGYEVFKGVIISGETIGGSGYTQFFGAKGKQPKAVIEFRRATVDTMPGLDCICIIRCAP